MKLSNYIFLGILILAVMLRFVGLSSNPPSLTWDEASWGYNAYSLGYDLSDEFGKFLPLTYLESFGDFKPPLYAYLDILPVKLFGLTEFAVRFPSAFFGSLTVFIAYFLVKEIFGQKKEPLALIVSFLLAISPWHIMLSRAAFEANVATFFVLLGLLFFLKGVKEKPYLLLLSSLSFMLSMYTFNSPRIVVPILILTLVVAFHKKLLFFWKQTTLAVVIGLIFYIPLLLFLRTPQAQLRFAEVNFFSEISTIERINQEIANDGNSSFSKIIHNRRFAFTVEYARHYLDNLTPSFLLIRGDGNPKFSIQDVGQLYLWEIPFLIIGSLLLFRKRTSNWWIVPILIVVGIVPAGFARETPHALRIESGIIGFQIITAIGIIGFYEFIKKKRIYISILGIIIFLNFFYFIHNYISNYSREFSGEWQYGYKESIEYINGAKDEYKGVYMTEELGRPYIYYLFYSGVKPEEFRKNSEVYRETLGFVHVRRIDDIYFEKEIGNIDKKGSLYVATPSEMPDSGKILKEFKLLNGKTSLVAYTL